MIFTEEIQNYAESFTSGESNVLRELREHCYAHFEDKAMLSGFVQGRILSMFSHMIRPHKVLEIGTYLGYSTICLAEGLADGGEVVSLDVNEETNRVAQGYIDKTEYANRIQLRLGEAAFVLPHVAGPYDLVFIDADKPNYANYYNLVFDKVRPGGFIIADNVLWSGKVLDEEKDENTQALHDFNKMVLADDRVENVLFPVRDGLMIVRKR
jgi:predicted O-methyltransferase YrrM